MNPEQALKQGWGMEAALSPLGQGHIHDTFLAQSASGRWVLQWVNQTVFPRPRQLMRNVARVSAHLGRKRHGWVPVLIPAQDGGHCAELGGEVWRLWSYIDGHSVAAPASGAQAESAGRAFGKTRRWLQGLAGERLPEVIPGFLQLDHYLAAFDRHRGAASQLAAFIDARRHLASRFRRRCCYIHGDCKIDNLVFDGAGKVVAVLDLDTVMWGHWAWEFGDLIRSVLSGAFPHSSAADGKVPSHPGTKAGEIAGLQYGDALLSRFQATASGYLAEADVRAGAEDLVLAPRYVTLMLGVRFLTDHLEGDRYFKVNAPGENRQRALAQFRLLEAMEAQEAALMHCARGLVGALGQQKGLRNDDEGD